MKFIEIYNTVLPYWGSEINFEDAIILKPEKEFKNVSKVKSIEDYFFSKKLSALWNSVEEKVGEEPYKK